MMGRSHIVLAGAFYLALWGCVWWAGGLDAILPILRSAF